MSFPSREFSMAVVTAITAGLSASVANAEPLDDGPAYGPELQGFAYPQPVQQFTFTSQGEGLHMAYMDVKPATPNGRTIVLLHGKNFCAATWASSIETLTKAGYRVIAPDQIGFCKSSKPAHYQYSFQQLAGNTHALLDSIGVVKPTLVAHSTGGMIATRYALMYPQDVEQLVLVNPIGLEDWKAKGVPWLGVDKWFEREKQTTATRIRDYEQATYYVNHWRSEYEPWVQMLAGMYRGAGRDIVAWNSALVDDMIFNQPVIYEFEQLKVPTLLLIGDKDTTAIGKDLAPPEVRAKLGHYPELARSAARRIPNVSLVEFPELGHAPQMQDPDAFHQTLLAGLRQVGSSSTSIAASVDDATAVAALDVQYQDAVKRNDADTMARVLHDDFHLVTGSGTVYDKAALVDDARKKTTTWQHQEEEPGSQAVRVYGDTAVVTAKLWLQGFEADRSFNVKVWFSDTYVRTSAGWRYFFGQASLAPPAETK